jgi:hypothetical protein
MSALPTCRNNRMTYIMARSPGQIHSKAKGSLYAIGVWIPTRPCTMDTELSCPKTCEKVKSARMGPRSLSGTISELYTWQVAIRMPIE